MNFKFHYILLLFSEDNQQIIFCEIMSLMYMLDMIEHSYIAVLLLILFFLLRLCEYLDYLLFQEEVLNYRWLKEEFIKNGFIGISKVIKSLTKSSIFFCSTFKNFNFLILFCSLFQVFVHILNLIYKHSIYVWIISYNTLDTFSFFAGKFHFFAKEKRILSIE